jgi:hypothetical protein
MILGPGTLSATPAFARVHRQTHAGTHRAAIGRRCARARASARAAHRAGARASLLGATAARLCAQAVLKTPRRAGGRRPGLPSSKRPVDWRPVVSSPLAPGSAEPTPPAEKEPRTKRKSRAPGTGLGGLPQEEGGVLTDPIDSRFLTKDPFGAASFWIQPWRAYLDTWPSSTLLSSLGINFNVTEAQAEPVAQLLQDSGFTLARREIPWAALSFEDPTQFKNEPKIAAILGAMRNHGLRPLILLNANSGEPTPAKIIKLTTTAAASPGAMTVRLDSASAALVVPGKTGFDGLTWGTGPDVLISSVNEEGVATLSRPLRSTLPAGKHLAMVLRYAPFQNPKLANGEPNPAFRETLDGWLSYVATVNAEATKVMGAGNYDLEVWNELTFGSQFLNSEHYYQPADVRTAEAEAEAQAAIEAQDQPGAPEDSETEESPESRANTQAIEDSESEAVAEEGPAEGAEEGAAEGSEAGGGEASVTGAARAMADPAGEEAEEGPPKDLTKAIINDKVTKAVTRTLLKETVAFVRNPANGISPSVGISDGFASQTPFPSGALAPVGLTALSKHLYNGAKQFPADYREGHIRPLNALGFRDTEDERGFTPLFVPHFQSLFPEYFLSAIPTETLVRDIAPITTQIYGLKHGREVGPVGGSPVQKWMTEYNIPSGKGTVMQADGITPAGVTLTAADRAHLQAKGLMRSLVANVNKGLSREYFFAAAPGALSLISKGFYSELEAHPESYPGDGLGGETMSGFRELFARFQGPGPEGPARQLKLLSIAQEGNHAQFAGDGTAAHPDLYDRDVLAVLPFQSSPTRFVIPVYVMTHDLMTLYEPGKPESDVTRFDLPSENFTIKLGNLPAGGEAPQVNAYDPLRHESTPARLISRDGETAEFEISATDYPRLLTLEFG